MSKTPKTSLAALGHVVRYRVGDALDVSEASYAPSLSIQPHSHDIGYLCVTLSGSDELGVATVGRRTSVMPGAVHYLPSNVPHANRFGSAGVSCLLIETGRDACSFLRDLRVDVERPWLIAGGPIAWRGLRLHHKCRSGLATALDVDEFLVTAFVSGLQTRSRERPAPRWVRDVQEALDVDIARPPRLATLARVANVHPVYLTKVLHERLGCGPGEYVQTQRITRACAMLLESDRSLARIALDLGYYDQCHFTRAFTARMGVAPGTLRRQLRGRDPNDGRRHPACACSRV